MAFNHYLKSKITLRSHVFEFLLVLVAISVLIAVAIYFYRGTTEGARHSVVEFNASVFFRMISTVNALGRDSAMGVVRINSTAFYLNENGWPATTDPKSSPSVHNQTKKECEQIWGAVFASASNSELSGKRYKENADYVVSLNGKGICRYSLSLKQEGSIFIDYDVSSGAVMVVRPD